jgi:YHS domain-containing protein
MSTTTDPVCGMGVDSESERRLEYAGKRYYFCSRHCVEKFSAVPEKYLNPIKPAPLITVSSDHGYTCPTHPEVHQATPGSCPICGLALEPTAVAAKEDNPELDDMTRRFWISTMLAVLVFLMAMAADMGMGFASNNLIYAFATGRILVGDSGRTVGRLAIFPARLDIHSEQASEYVHADFGGCRRGLVV